jgi:YidC/Oxa1 family membrane protein insertase
VAAEAAVAEPVTEVLVGETEARDIVVETDTVRAVFSTRGAVLTSWELKGHADEEGEPLDLVPPDIPESEPRPFAMATDDEAMSATLGTALFRPSADGLSLGSTPGTLNFQYRDASGLNALKTFHFQPDGRPYMVNVEAAIDVDGASQPVRIDWGPALGLGYTRNGSRQTPARGLVYTEGSVSRYTASALIEEPVHAGQFLYVGVEDHYFVSVAFPSATTLATVEYRPVELPLAGDPDITRAFIAYSITLPGAANLPFFLGPKDFTQLEAIDPQFTRAIDFGIFAWLVVPLLKALKWVNGFVANYGWSIIVLTTLINIAIFPLRHKSMVSMRKMSKLQPKIKDIQARYKGLKATDPQRQKMNQEMMALYKQEGVNPASGCVPMLLTMPILFAFYSMLSVAIELRHAPFFGFIQDLAAPDPSYITPILMGGSMFLQQKMMPSTADPVQRRMFLMMPVVFTVMFLWAPSGLVIYWLSSNVMAIGQQYITNRLHPPAPPAPPKAPPVAAAVTPEVLPAAAGGSGKSKPRRRKRRQKS